jgi:uncharacterized protein
MHSNRTESIPPIATGLVLSEAQIRYCLSENVRIEVWRNRLQTGSGTSVQAFNTSVNDYNARCSNFRYRRDTFATVRAEVEASRPELTQEALLRAASFEIVEASPQVQGEPASSVNVTAPLIPTIPTSVQTFTTSFDCAKASADAERIICGDAELAASDVALASLFARAQAVTADKAGFKQHAREQWNDRQRNCHDRDCLLQWYAKQNQWLSAEASASLSSTVKPTGELEGPQPSAALSWAHTVAQHHADANAAYDLAKRSLAAVNESCPDAILLQQIPETSGPYKPVVMFLSQKCGYIVSYWPESGDEQVSFDRRTIDRWSGYCSTHAISKTDCTRSNGA